MAYYAIEVYIFNISSILKEERKLKVYSKSQSWQKGYSTKYKEVPSIILFGECLAKCSFKISYHINVKVSDDKIFITKE